ncbi:GNAT family N-acetyltransferase [Fictibacillus sp. KU28468]|uniref:GNAT family N-acetyltransferase n=1 Tax=Fictibacillus sp. KU28468 TaxID=2991053 RepID=UPI00223D1ED8|nr:GNAT family N-acetyltransferase [Fictibacillus sp. KU28468]UZJ78660.1 GNAT family N-acetyltransferase [Fictibacillus sp. KU28468]
MNITLERITLEKKPVLRQMLELYRYDFSEFDGSDLSKEGRYGYTYLDAYWEEEGRYPFFIIADELYAGFILVRKNQGIYHMAEFFILKKYRKQGLGKAAAFAVFNQFPGDWDIAQIPQNKPAQAFWTSIIHDYTNGNFTDQFSDKDNVRFQTFTSVPQQTRMKEATQ